MAEPGEGAEGAQEAELTEIDTAQYFKEREAMTGQTSSFYNFDEAPLPEEAGAQEAPPTGEAEPEGQQEETPAAPEPAAAEADGEAERPAAESGKPDGDGESGTKPGDAKRNDDPHGVRKRLDRKDRRFKRQREADQAEIARLRAQLDEKNQQGQQTSRGEQPPPDPPTGQAEASDPDDVPYPSRSDYDTDQAYLDDVDNWMEGNPLNKSAKKPEQSSQATPPSGENREPPRRGDEARQRVEELFSDLEEAIDEWDGSSETLADDFFDLIARTDSKPSQSLIEYMAGNDEGAQLAAVFVASPRKYRRLLRLPASQQVEAMKELIDGAAQQAAPEGKPKRSSVTPAPDVKPIGGRGDPPKKTIADAEDFKDFESIRQGMNRDRRGSGFHI